jgi:hypothetical protein
VFEYGSGNSTLWWVRRVVACEHDAGWARRLSPDLPANVELMVQELAPDGAYCRSILQAGGPVRDRRHRRPRSRQLG